MGLLYKLGFKLAIEFPIQSYLLDHRIYLEQKVEMSYQ